MKMKFFHQLKIVIITIISVLCVLLLINLCRKIRFVLPWRVNCWFCNHNIWVKLSQRNCWTCPRCEQYNGFTRDGDYNKQLFSTTDHAVKTQKIFKRSPPKNGLCKMCNINQQLKVTQLANFVPMNDRNYDNEIEAYRVQIEKAYKLCTPCKRVLEIKLHKEKETLLGSKLLNARTPEKKWRKKEKQHDILQSGINSLSIIIALLLFLLVSIDFGKAIKHDDNLSNTILNIKEIIKSLSERLLAIAKIKMSTAFPTYEGYLNDLTKSFNYDPDIVSKVLSYVNFISDDTSELVQEVLVGFACLLQILGQIIKSNKQKYAFITDLLLMVFIITCVVPHVMTVAPLMISSIKISCIALHLITHKSFEAKKPTTGPSITQSPPRKMKNLARKTSIIDDETETSALDTDDDVSLSKFGLHNFTDSSNETSPINKSLNSGRMFMPRSQDSMWTKPQMNSTFCVNSVVCKSPSSVSDTVFVKPSFNKYQKLARDDSDSELDESISSLCIGSPHKSKRKPNSIFSLKKFSAAPSFVAPRATLTNGGRPLISPSALGHSASWVAGGYWGSEGERQIFNINGSRSSSQSSGFESQASSMNQRTARSQPPSREDSDCGEPDRAALLMDRFQNCNMSNYGYGPAQAQAPSFSRVSSPVYPQMQYNGHVHIPQPRLARNAFGFTQQQHYVQNLFKAPASSGIIKLPQACSFSSR